MERVLHLLVTAATAVGLIVHCLIDKMKFRKIQKHGRPKQAK